jgi:transposase-like protein
MAVDIPALSCAPSATADILNIAGSGDTYGGIDNQSYQGETEMKPYLKAFTLKFVGLQDRRRKLTDEQRAEIKHIRLESGESYRAIARRFGVSRSLVAIICDDERVKAVHDRMAAHWREYRMTKEERRRRMRELRKRKYTLYKAGMLGEKYTPPMPRVAVPTTVKWAKTPDGERIAVRIPTSFAEGKAGAERIGRKWRIVRNDDGKFLVYPKTESEAKQ